MSEEQYCERIALRWADLDVNGHVRHTVYYDLGSRQRMRALAAGGLTLLAMQEHALGPVLFREECRFFKEIHLDDEVDIEVRILGLSRDHRKFRFQHQVMRTGERCATIEVDGAWLDMRTRRIFVPPSVVVEAIEAIPKAEAFTYL